MLLMQLSSRLVPVKPSTLDDSFPAVHFYLFLFMQIETRHLTPFDQSGAAAGRRYIAETERSRCGMNVAFSTLSAFFPFGFLPNL
jgi:hypothetical protein